MLFWVLDYFSYIVLVFAYRYERYFYFVFIKTEVDNFDTD
jgi:hypothetical protein